MGDGDLGRRRFGARGRLASFIGDAIAAAVILGGGLFFFALTTFDARAGQATPARLSELKFWLWVGGGAVAFILLFALATMRLSGTIASEEEARDPVNYRRS